MGMNEFKEDNVLRSIYSYFTKDYQFTSVVSKCELFDYLDLLYHAIKYNAVYEYFDYDYLKEKKKVDITLDVPPYYELDEYAFHKFIKLQKDLQYKFESSFNKSIVKYYLDIFIKYKELLDKLKEEEEK